jgi:hypothetical protein
VLAAAWELRRGSVLGSRPRDMETTRSHGFAILTFTRESRSSVPAHESATMVLQHGRWRILHDTMLEDAIAAYTHSLAIRGQAGASAAVRRGFEASRRFRDLASDRRR